VNSPLLFVYGSLRRQFEGHALLERLGARYIGRASVPGRLFDLGRFPGAIKTNVVHEPGQRLNSSQVNATPEPAEQPRVLGEIFQLRNPQRALSLLDQYEGLRPSPLVRSLYARELVEATLEDGERVVTWIYWLNRLPKGMRRITSGDYRSRHAKP
jgi:gamma-glutamylcyclotransferase (GGCT)/AIG2-like uncharacterized protein YtfP